MKNISPFIIYISVILGLMEFPRLFGFHSHGPHSTAYGAESPCFWQGSYTKCFPSSGIKLDDGQLLYLQEDTGHTVSLKGQATGGAIATWTMVLPSNHGTTGQVLTDTLGDGELGWADPGATTTYVNAYVGSLGSKRIAELVCHSNITLSGVQTCDGQLTSGASVVLAMAQTDVTENGLWLVDDFIAWSRPIGWSGGSAAIPGSWITISEQGAGTTYQDTAWFGIGDGSSTANFRLVPTTASNVQLTASRALVTDANNHLAAATTTATEIGYVNGVSSAIQTQLNTKTTNPGTTTGDIFYCSDTATPCTVARRAVGSSTTVLHGGTTPAYSAVVLTTDVSGVLPIANGGSNKGLTLAAGGLLWTDADSFEVGAAGTSQNWALSGGTGAPTFSNTTTTGKFFDGSADEVQARVQGHSTQTANILAVEKSDTTLLFAVTNVNGTAIKGDTTNGGAATGFVGEILTGSNSGASLTASQYNDATSKSITAGTWDIIGCVGYNPAASTVVTRIDTGISTTTGNSGTGLVNMENEVVNFFHAGNVPTDTVTICTPTYRINLSASTTYYLKAYSVFTVSTMTADGFIRATRIR